MQSSIFTHPRIDTGVAGIRPQVYPRLRLSVIAVFFVFTVYCISRLVAEPAENVVCALAIAAAALAPAYFWASGRVGGLPILPAHAATLLLAFGLPLVSGHPEIAAADADAIFFASFCVVLYAAIATGCWYALLRGRIEGRGIYRVLPPTRGYRTMLAVLLAGTAFNILLIGGMVDFASVGLYAVVRAVSIALTSIALFIVAVRLGGRGLTPGQRVAAAAVIGFFILTQAATLFLGAPIISAVALIVGYAVGGQRIPWAGTLVAILVLGVLHAGKGEMREQYWSGAGPGTISVAAFPEFFAAWTAAGFREMRGAGDESRQPIYERISLMHVLLLAQGKASGPAEFLYGETYALIPKTLLPRFLDPDKPSPHDATNLLSLHYGLQTESDQQEGTMIGWGMIAEGYANFGVAGIAAVAALVGAFLGLITRITVAAPFMSLQNFLGILIMVISVQTELVMVVLVTATLQSVASLLLLWPICEIRRIPGHA